MREAEFGLDCPSVRADIDELVGVVLAGRRRDRDARPERGPRLALNEFGQRECGRTDEVRRKLELGVGEPRARRFRILAIERSREVSRRSWLDDPEGRRAAEKAESAPKPERDRVHFGLDIVHRQGGVRQDAAGRPGKCREEKRRADGIRGVGARFHLLSQ